MAAIPATEVGANQRRSDIPEFGPGDHIRVHVRVTEGEKERVQVFQGTVIRIRGEGIKRSFTARKVVGGIGVERIFPIHSPKISKLEVLSHGKVRRAKLYYIRQRKGKAARITQRRTR